MSALDPNKFNRRIYVINDGDVLSLQKALELETKIATQEKSSVRWPWDVLFPGWFSHSSTISSQYLELAGFIKHSRPRLSLHATRWWCAAIIWHCYPFSAVDIETLPTSSSLMVLGHVLFFALLSTSIRLVPVSTTWHSGSIHWFIQFFGLHAPHIVYVETFARVNSLSLSGKLVRPFADR